MLDLEALLSETKELPPCGPNLEHDLSFFELEEAARGKPEELLGKAEERRGTGVKPAEDPKWPKVVELGQALLVRSKDLRTGVYLTRALIRTEGIPGLAAGLSLIEGLLSRHWEGVHPQLEDERDGGPTARLNALAPLADPQRVIKDLRDAFLVNSREHGQLQARDVEIAQGRLVAPRSADAAPVKPLDQIHAQLAAAFASDTTPVTGLRVARERTLAIQTVITDRVGSERTIELKPLVQSLENLLEACDAALGTRRASGANEPTVHGGATSDAEGGASAGFGEIRNREQAVVVLERVCAYLERYEPSNPAPLFIRRAQRLMTKTFVDIVKDLMPDSLPHLERLAGQLEQK